jgi:hypothetical protein
LLSAGSVDPSHCDISGVALVNKLLMMLELALERLERKLLLVESEKVLLNHHSFLSFSLSRLGKLLFTFLDLGFHTRNLVRFLLELFLALARLLGDELD